MKRIFVYILLVFELFHQTSYVLAGGPIDIVRDIQSRAQKERLLESTKENIFSNKLDSVDMNMTRIKNMVEEIESYHLARQRQMPPVLAYIVQNKKTIFASSDPLVQSILETYMQERYARYVASRTYEENKRTERHQEALAALPPDTVIPTPRASDTYQSIVVDISDQRMYAFEEGILIASSPITSGKKWFSTVRGDFDVKKKQTNRILTSPFKNRDINYRLHVDYWIQFYKWFGIHDACNSKNCWRKEFGTSDYATRGSHGCVNTPYEFVSWLYEWVLPKTRVSVIQ